MLALARVVRSGGRCTCLLRVLCRAPLGVLLGESSFGGGGLAELACCRCRHVAAAPLRQWRWAAEGVQRGEPRRGLAACA